MEFPLVRIFVIENTCTVCQLQVQYLSSLKIEHSSLNILRLYRDTRNSKGMKSSGRFKSGGSLGWISMQNFIKMRNVHELTWQVRGPLCIGSSLSFQPSHAFCLNKIEETDSNNPPLALYEKKNSVQTQALTVIS